MDEGDEQVTLAVSATEHNGGRISPTITRRLGAGTVSRTTSQHLKPDAWFVFVESASRIWIFDGNEELCVLTMRLGNPGTWGSQISNFLYIAETDGLVALCDQWWAGPAGRNDLEQSRYVWVPVVFDPNARQAKANFRWKCNPFLRKSWAWNGDETGPPQPNYAFTNLLPFHRQDVPRAAL